MRQHHRHSAVRVVQRGDHMEYKRVISLPRRRYTDVKTMVRIHSGKHFFRLISLFVDGRFTQKTRIPFIQRKRRIGDDDLEFFQSVIFQQQRICQCIAVHNFRIIDVVQKHIHLAKRPRLRVLFLAINTDLGRMRFCRSLQQ